jgi:hypothetical protein
LALPWHVSSLPVSIPAPGGLVGGTAADFEADARAGGYSGRIVLAEELDEIELP